ncbi:MAG: hypothetical protein ACREOM_02995 [Candidatus Dormibacteraceae bacterium]
MAGHKMGGYVMVPVDWSATPAPISALIRRALTVASALPAKTPKKATAKKPAKR